MRVPFKRANVLNIAYYAFNRFRVRLPNDNYPSSPQGDVGGRSLGAAATRRSRAGSGGNGSGTRVRTVHGNAPSWARSASVVGATNPNRTLTVHIGLAPRNPAGIAKLAAAVSNPKSSSYRHYLSPKQYLSRFGPTDAQVAKVRSFLRGAGLRSSARRRRVSRSRRRELCGNSIARSTPRCGCTATTVTSCARRPPRPRCLLRSRR